MIYAYVGLMSSIMWIIRPKTTWLQLRLNSCCLYGSIGNLYVRPISTGKNITIMLFIERGFSVAIEESRRQGVLLFWNYLSPCVQMLLQMGASILCSSVIGRCPCTLPFSDHMYMYIDVDFSFEVDSGDKFMKRRWTNLS